MDTIRIRGARTHNLANIDVDLPRPRLYKDILIFQKGILKK